MCAPFSANLLAIEDKGAFLEAQLTSLPSLAPSLQRPMPATKLEMTKFHSDDYIDFLETITPQTLRKYKQELRNCSAPKTPPPPTNNPATIHLFARSNPVAETISR